MEARIRAEMEAKVRAEIAAGDLERLLARLERHLLTVVLVRVSGDLLEVEVRDVGVHRGHAPRDLGVVTDHDTRQAREREASDVVGAGRVDGAAVEPDLVPDARHRRCQVWVVREDRLTRGGLVAADDP